MSTESYYFRDEDYLYPIEGHPEYWFYTGRTEDKQALLGLIGNDLIVFQFDSEGNRLGDQETLFSVNDFVKKMEGKELQEVQLQSEIERQIRLFRTRTGFEDTGIQVKRFRLREINVGIEDMPDDVQECLLNPSAFSEQDRVDLTDTLEGWKDENLFVFWWGQSFTMDAEGLVTSS